MSEKTTARTTLFIYGYSHIKDGDKVGVSQIAVMAANKEEGEQLAIQRAEARGHKNIRLGTARVY